MFGHFFKNTIIMLMMIGLIIPAGFAAKSHKKIKSAQHHTNQHLTKKIVQKKSSANKHPRKKTAHILPKKHKNLPNKKKRIRSRTQRAAIKHLPSTTVNTSNIAHSLEPAYSLSTMEKNLVSFVRNTIESIRYTTYKLGGTRIEPARGIYVVDCSSYVDHILKNIYPRAYTSLAEWSGTQKPTTNDFYHYFQNLSDDSSHWNSIDDADELRPGDILVFRNKNRAGNEVGGHVMIVMDKPERNGNTLLVRIADAAPAGHTKDTRMPHASGIGIGSMLLKLDPYTSRPYAYSWKVGSRWESNVNFAMARPLGFA